MDFLFDSVKGYWTFLQIKSYLLHGEEPPKADPMSRFSFGMGNANSGENTTTNRKTFLT